MEKENPKFIKTWEELSKCTSETHELKVDLRYGNGFIISKDGSKNIHISDDCITDRLYLSTHTFYGNKHEFSTKMLQQCGFNVILANWNE